MVPDHLLSGMILQVLVINEVIQSLEMVENEWLSLGSFQSRITGVILAHLVCKQLILWQMKSGCSTSSSFSILVPAFFRYFSIHFLCFWGGIGGGTLKFPIKVAAYQHKNRKKNSLKPCFLKNHKFLGNLKASNSSGISFKTTYIYCLIPSLGLLVRWLEKIHKFW